jgi:acetyl esterase
MSAAWARHPDLASVSFAEARRIAEEVRAPWSRGGPAVASTDTTIAGVRVRRYGSSEPVLIYLHGGGWTLFSLDTHDRLMREYAARAGVTVIGVDYALSPEAKYPVALEQVVAVARSIGESAIGGDSAGANLAIAACMREPGLFRAMVLNYGVFDRHSSKEARERLGGPGNMLTADEMEGFWRNYLRDERDADDPYVSPLRGDLRGLPPALLVVPEYDLLAEQSIKLADRLEAAKLRIYPGAVHSFLEAVSIAPLADLALEETASWIRASLAL